jgi:excisionase family DNA binding protein
VFDANKPGDDMEPLMTIEEVAAVLRVPVATLRYWRHHGRGPAAFRQGKRVFYTREAVQAHLDSLTAASAA